MTILQGIRFGSNGGQSLPQYQLTARKLAVLKTGLPQALRKFLPGMADNNKPLALAEGQTAREFIDALEQAKNDPNINADQALLGQINAAIARLHNHDFSPAPALDPAPPATEPPAPALDPAPPAATEPSAPAEPLAPPAPSPSPSPSPSPLSSPSIPLFSFTLNEAEIAALSQKITDATKEIRRLEDQLAPLVQERKEKASSLQQKKKDNTKNNQEVQAFDAESAEKLAAFTAEDARLRTAKEAAQSVLSTLETTPLTCLEISDLTGEAMKIATRLQNQIQSSDTPPHIRNAQQTRLNELLTDREAIAQAAARRKQAAQTSLTEAKQAYDAFIISASASSTYIPANRAEMERLKAALPTLEQEISALSQSLVDLDAKIKQINTAIGNQRKTAQTTAQEILATKKMMETATTSLLETGLRIEAVAVETVALGENDTITLKALRGSFQRGDAFTKLTLAEDQTVRGAVFQGGEPFQFAHTSQEIQGVLASPFIDAEGNEFATGILVTIDRRKKGSVSSKN